MQELERFIPEIRSLKNGLYGEDFLLTWDKTVDDLRLILKVARSLRALYGNNRSCRLFESGLAVSQFRDNSTRTRFSFASACNLLGLAVQDLDEGRSQIAHGETVRETATMISFLTEVIGIRDDIFLGAGHTYMVEASRALDEGFREGVLPQRPAVINLQCDLDHPTQTLADLLHLEHQFGSLDNLRGKKIAMSWAYSPSSNPFQTKRYQLISVFTRKKYTSTLSISRGRSTKESIISLLHLLYVRNAALYSQRGRGLKSRVNVLYAVMR